MLTLDGLVQLMPTVAFTDEDARHVARVRRVTGASPADAVLHRPSRGTAASHLLLTSIDAHWWSEPDRCMWAVRTVAQSEASALLVLPSKGRPGRGDNDAYNLLAHASRRLRLPLLRMRPGGNGEGSLLETVSRLVEVETAKAETRYMEALVDHLRPSGSPSVNDLPALLRHMSQVVDGHAAFISSSGNPPGQGQPLHHILQGKGATSLSRIRQGHIGAASLNQTGYHVQLVGIGTRLPRPVLAVARRNPFPPRTSNLINRTAAALAIREQLVGNESVARELRQTLPLARLAIFTQLMSGDAETSRKLAKPLLPDLLNAAQYQVFLLECPVRQRTAVVHACEEAIPDQVLIVESPTTDTHIVIIAQADPAQDNGPLRRTLGAITTAYSCYLGESRPVHPERVREGHRMATQALVVARRQPGRSAAYHGEHQLGQVLDEQAHSWAHTLLEPLSDLPARDRQTLITTLGQALRRGHNGAARHMRLNRKTVTSRCKRVETLLGIDLSSMQSRARLDLALQLAELSAGPASGPAPHLADILRTPAAQAWAQELLAPLQRDSRPLARTARAWIACNGRVETCAEYLGTHPNTVRNHLAACGQLLGRRIVGSGSGTNDLVLALEIVADDEIAQV
jgi:sugar diacid utilization regulator